MANIHFPLHQVDDIVLKEKFDFSQSVFDLNEPSVVSVSHDFSTLYHIIKEKISGYENLLEVAYVITRSILKNLSETVNIIHDADFDVLRKRESFSSGNTPKAPFGILGYNFLHIDRNMSYQSDAELYTFLIPS